MPILKEMLDSSDLNDLLVYDRLFGIPRPSSDTDWICLFSSQSGDLTLPKVRQMRGREPIPMTDEQLKQRGYG